MTKHPVSNLPFTTPMGVYPIRRKLPASYSTEIGRIITRFSYAEHLLRRTTYRLLRLNPKQGRLAVREPRVEEHLTLIHDLAALEGLHLETDWKELKRVTKELEVLRDRLAHGIWIKHPGTKTPVLQVLSGSNINTQQLHRKPRIDPIAVPLTLAELRRATKAIDTTIDYLSALNRKVVLSMQRVASLDKSP